MASRIRVIPGRNLDTRITGAWLDLLATNPELASPYFRPEFTSAVAEVRDDIEVAVVETDGEIVALFPFQRGAGGAGGPIGGILSDFQAIIARPDFAFDPLELVRACRLVAWDFDHLLVSQKPFQRFHRQVEDSPRMDLSRGYPAYAAERRAAGSEQIKKCENLMRRVEREIGPLKFSLHAPETVTLEQVLSLKSRQYAEGGNPDLFAETWIRTLAMKIHTTQSAEFAGMLSTLCAGDRLVAGHFGMRSRTAWHYWFPAYDEAMSKYSPGLILLLKMAEAAPTLGLHTIDLGKGLSQYKQRLMSGAVSVATGSVELPSLLSLRRAAHRNLRRIAANSPLGGPARQIMRRLRGAPKQS
jgi:CelD/BcsL family acetyltransferase involved in cellulose biosynthesis